MNKNLRQEIADLRAGLVAIQNILKNPKTNRMKYEKAIINEEIQIARIDFFIKGYNLCSKEINAQRKLE
ncbi:MAG TPA: hypothetical protein VMZ91_03095 [Candidatus Paceibacterota bacterium]|nr:hypothetical protein [Candidatus Paceibacterota bacterium]